MKRRTVVKALAAAPFILSTLPKEGMALQDCEKEWPKTLDLVNPVSKDRYVMAFEQNAPIDGSLQIDSFYKLAWFQHTTMCRTKEAIVLTGILLDGSPDSKISVTVDGEYVLKEATQHTASAAKLLPRQPQTDLFTAETQENEQIGIFLPNGTNIQIFVSEMDSTRIRATLRMALYTSQGRRCRCHDGEMCLESRCSCGGPCHGEHWYGNSPIYHQGPCECDNCKRKSADR